MRPDLHDPFAHDLGDPAVAFSIRSLLEELGELGGLRDLDAKRCRMLADEVGVTEALGATDSFQVPGRLVLPRTRPANESNDRSHGRPLKP